MTQQDAPQTIDIDPGALVERVDTWVDGAVKLAPNMVVALVLLVVAFAFASFIGALIYKRFKKRGRNDLGLMLKGLVKWSILFIALLFAATIVIPSLKLGEMIGGLGVGSVAIGFAFKDILQNWLAGFLILLRQPFNIGDQIEVNGYEGTVETIQARSTLIKTYDGQRAVIPNSDIYTNSVLVKTAHKKRRSQYDIGVGYGDNLELARDVIKNAISSVRGVEQDPEPQALPWDLASSWIAVRARWWTDSKRADVVEIRSAVIVAIKNALDDAGIDMPYETQVHLFHDQTEDGDGDRSSQREGWPDEGEGTKPRWIAKEEIKLDQQK
jgi:small-conductance mechanosensitive channel